jgi:hypothetical protein
MCYIFLCGKAHSKQAAKFPPKYPPPYAQGSRLNSNSNPRSKHQRMSEKSINRCNIERPTGIRITSTDVRPRNANGCPLCVHMKALRNTSSISFLTCIHFFFPEVHDLQFVSVMIFWALEWPDLAKSRRQIQPTPFHRRR